VASSGQAVTLAFIPPPSFSTSFSSSSGSIAPEQLLCTSAFVGQSPRLASSLPR
jgi:hypothetical protein